MPPAPSKPITSAEFYPTLLDTDRVVATRTAANEPDIAKRVGLLPPVALVDYLAPRLYRGGNGSGVPVKVVDFYDPTEPGFDPLKHSALTTLDPAFLCLKTRCIIVNPRPNQPGEYVLEYNTFSAATMRVWRDGRFSQSGQQSDAQWYAVKSPEAAAPEWASLQAAPPVANYNFPVKYLLRHPFAGNQLFFETKVAGVLPAPSLADGDANYLRVARETVPVPAFDAFQGDYNPQANAPALSAAVGTRGHYYRVSQPGVTVNTTSTTATSASTALSVTSAAGIAVGMRITGAGIAAGTTIGAIVGAALTLSAPATVAANTPVTAETFAVGLSGFVVNSEIFYTGTAWTLRAVPGAAGGGAAPGPATATTLGSVIIGANVAVTAGGVISVAAPTPATPQATNAALGTVRGGGTGNASVNADGSLSVPTGATAWTAGEPIAAGQLKFNSAAVLFYAKAAIASPAAQPFVFGSSVATNDLYAHAHSGAPEWNFNTYYRRGQIVEVPFPGGALYVCNETHTGGSNTDPIGNLFTQALTSRWNLVSRQANTVETVIAAGGNTNNLRPAALSLETFRTPATGTVTLGTATDASGRTKPGEGYTLVITQSRAGGITFDPVSFANTPRLSGAAGTDILRFYTDAAGKLYCWSDGQGLVTDTFAALTYAASIALDFNAATVQTLAATGNVALAASLNVALLKTKELYITNTTGAAITLSCPAGWSFFPGPAPTTLAASKQAVLTLRAVGTTDSTIKAAYVAQA